MKTTNVYSVYYNECGDSFYIPKVKSFVSFNEAVSFAMDKNGRVYGRGISEFTVHGYVDFSSENDIA